jgi:hypothetical protein
VSVRRAGSRPSLGREKASSPCLPASRAILGGRRLPPPSPRLSPTPPRRRAPGPAIPADRAGRSA